LTSNMPRGRLGRGALAPQSANLLRYAHGRLLGILVLPYADNGPSCFFEYSVGLCIPLACTGDLLGPEIGIGCGLGVMYRTAMPEASVKEYRHLRLGENQVGRTANALYGASGYAIAKTEGMYGTSQGEFGLGVPPFVRLHALAHALAGRADWSHRGHEENNTQVRNPSMP
jgi:hypothetical protein